LLSQEQFPSVKAVQTDKSSQSPVPRLLTSSNFSLYFWNNRKTFFHKLTQQNKKEIGGINMKNSTMLVALPVFIAMAFSVAFAMNHTPEERGKAHFNNPNFAGGKKACSTCHPGGSGLSGVGDKKEFHIMGHQQGSLEEAINECKQGKGNCRGLNGNARDGKLSQIARGKIGRDFMKSTKKCRFRTTGEGQYYPALRIQVYSRLRF